MVFCNKRIDKIEKQGGEVTILILIDGFLQYRQLRKPERPIHVTILILIDGFLQCNSINLKVLKSVVTILILIDGFLQYMAVL